MECSLVTFEHWLCRTRKTCSAAIWPPLRVFLLLRAIVQNPLRFIFHFLTVRVLVLLFGFTPRQLAQVQCAEQNGSLELTFRRKPASYGRRFYNREQILKLPVTPVWFFNLQKRFHAQWQNRYEKTKKTYPHKPLLLPHHHNYNRLLSSDEARERIKVATHAALGHYIQARILRQTCGHLYSKNGDASILSRMGWSAQFAFCYTWAPRIYYSPKPQV